MDFIPSNLEPTEQTEPAWWFAFSKHKLLVEQADETVAVPWIRDLAEFNLEPIRKQYLGTLNGHPCYSAELPDGAPEPDGMSFLGLRRLFGLMEETFYKIAGLGFEIVKWDQTHQYCSRCGASTEKKHDERAKICPECGLVNYPRISPAIIVAITKNDQILLARANHFPTKLYSVIAGYVELGESLEECVRREIREEVGIEVKNIRYFGSQSWPYTNSMMIGFTSEYASGEIRVDEVEIADAGWFDADNLPRLPGWGSIAKQLIDWFLESR
ncbi:NAD(+) diphosphatase [Desulfonema magnum]|uniref:NAD(+) diphosphatase n=1 Tax=Desulfonema magnum TaxID=45655 RepID=A0A975GLQ8_9BACT|nr:NAD(+) diphosphatase [Desulfonema magnum]QTA86096.1 Hydrolase, NUDIX family [Desulfonema magnum]